MLVSFLVLWDDPRGHDEYSNPITCHGKLWSMSFIGRVETQ